MNKNNEYEQFIETVSKNPEWLKAFRSGELNDADKQYLTHYLTNIGLFDKITSTTKKIKETIKDETLALYEFFNVEPPAGDDLRTGEPFDRLKEATSQFIEKLNISDRDLLIALDITETDDETLIADIRSNPLLNIDLRYFSQLVKWYVTTLKASDRDTALILKTDDIKLIHSALTDPFHNMDSTKVLALRNQVKKHNTRRVKSKAGDIDTIPAKIATPTIKGFETALTFNEAGETFLAKLNEAKQSVVIKDGVLYIDGMDTFSRESLQLYINNEDIRNHNTALLGVVYATFLLQYEKTGKVSDRVRIYESDLATACGLKNPNKEQIDKLINDLASYNKIMGNMKSNYEGEYRSIAAILVGERDPDTRTVLIYSPYFCRLIKAIASTGDKKRSLPKHHYLELPSMAKERDTAAVEIANYILKIIATAGVKYEYDANGKRVKDANGIVKRVGTPHVKPQTIIDNCPVFRKKINASSNPPKEISDTFATAWRYLENDTTLLNDYYDIQLIKHNIGVKNLNKTITFRHYGKLTEAEKNRLKKLHANGSYIKINRHI